MKLYFAPGTRAMRPRWMLEELGVPYEVQQLDLMKGEHKQPAYMKIHPLGVVPALDDNGFVMIESAAIVMHLADKFPEKGFAPAPGTNERGEYYQWISYVMTEAEKPLVEILMHTRFLPEAQRSPTVIATSSQRFKQVAVALEERMKGREYVVGSKFSAADVVVGGVLSLGAMLGQLGDYPALQAYVQRLHQRPAAQKVFGH
ncbi:glutathione S-transferase family protein [Hyalangium rubrum]|uniref:Glutathione S-transferase family protein n=1 Tax=Hyalangium rubrum TaxID=3103134 RepID=A0ABU5H1C6_9BACT|nr:glutathione S-transferase family protein [Hyalangium sp. s54d21]MDY7225925.1 glutathione S-transferase family protein [Hyalangium sp. s54d21]